MIISERMTADVEGKIVVFIIGMRINRFWAVHKWWPVFKAMPRMLKEISADKDSGYLGGHLLLYGLRSPALVQYWHSFEALHDYAHDENSAHLPAWRAFNRAVGGDGMVGIFHETYLVEPGAYENVYANMPPFGLGKVAGLRPAKGEYKNAKSRLEAGMD